jgi:hypothetical protein
LVIAIQPQRFDSTLAIAIFISGGHSTSRRARDLRPRGQPHGRTPFAQTLALSPIQRTRIWLVIS